MAIIKEQLSFDLESVLLQEYSIRESLRARTVRLNMTPQNGLVIVVPAGFNRKRLPDILREKKSWIENARRWADEQRLLNPPEPVARPDSVTLEAIDEIWSVFYRSTGSARTSAREHSDLRLLVSGNASETCAATLALRRWTARKARKSLIPWLEDISTELDLPFGEAIVRNQRTLWASCSPEMTISLNQKLLLLPARLVRYVLVHELCHTIHLNHSKRFWSLVGRKEPAYAQLRRELSGSWKYVPMWMEE
ncbi:MAG: YgjP-like metallopeptidase domain-containing protein [Thermoleophilia bacterium]